MSRKLMSEAAAILGSIRTAKKARASAMNGRLGGRRPKGSLLSVEENRELRRLQQNRHMLTPEGIQRLEYLEARNRPTVPPADRS